MKDFKEKLALVPAKPGSYQMKNKDGLIIYVGKAKNLQRRLRSYFTRTVTGKTKMLVEDIDDFEYIVTSSELESLILEITLIKKYDPKYNILLRDDKSYPYIELTNENPPLNRFFRMLDSQNTRPIAVSEEAKRGVELCINNEWLAILNAIKGRAPKLLGAYQKEKIKWTPKTVEYALLTGACRFYFSSFEVLFKSPDVTPERLLKYIDVLYKWS